MKKYSIISIFLFALYSCGWSQLQWSVVGGCSPTSYPKQAKVFVNRSEPQEFLFELDKVASSFFAGAKAKIEFNSNFFADLGVTYVVKQSTFQCAFTYFNHGSSSNELAMKETQHIVQLPVGIGSTIGNFQVTSGFLAGSMLGKSSDLAHMKGFSSDKASINMGWYTGLGYNIVPLRLCISVEYQKQFNRVGKGMFINGHPLELRNVPGQLVFFLGFAL